jgi:uncharacterized protein YfiM (DUF2279 family)
MKKLTLTLAMLAAFNAQAGDNGYDQHFIASAALGGAGAILTAETEHPVMYGVGIAMVFGVAKEAYDKAHPKSHTASMGDLAADLVGAVAGAWVGHGLTVSTSKHRVEVGITIPF